MPTWGRLFYPLSRKNVIAPLAKECGNAIGVDGGIDARATEQSPGLFLPNADAFGASCLLHCVQFTQEQAPALRNFCFILYNRRGLAALSTV